MLEILIAICIICFVIWIFGIDVVFSLVANILWVCGCIIGVGYLFGLGFKFVTG